MKPLAFLPALACLLATAPADDQTRNVQGALKGQGYYYGEVTGTENAETGAAIRRFQIRNGITVTGKLDADTLVALGLGEKKTGAVAPQPAQQPAPAPTVAANMQLNPPPPATVAPKPGEPVKRATAPLPETETNDAAQPAAQQPVRRAKLNDPSVIEPPAPLPAPVASAFSTMFRDTPYSNAPRDVQMNIVRRAQAVMAARGFYRGPLDGVAGPATSEAIFLFQDGAELHRTGRLDPDTLAEMKLLPQPAPGNPLLKPFYNPNRRRDRSVSGE